MLSLSGFRIPVRRSRRRSMPYWLYKLVNRVRGAMGLNIVKPDDPPEPPAREHVWCRYHRGGHWAKPSQMRHIDGYNFVNETPVRRGICKTHALIDNDDVLDIHDALKGDMDFKTLLGGMGNEKDDPQRRAR